MPYTPHIEQHFTGGLVVRDTVIGLSDGLTVPFALAAAVTGAIDSTGLVVTAGLAEIAAGSIAMGLGGYLAGRSDVEHYANEREREELEIEQKPDVEALEVTDLLQSYGLTSEESEPVVAALRKHPEAWRDFMLRFELGLEQPNPRRALTSGLVIGSAYIVGGLIPLGPYFVSATAHGALPWSVGVTLTALAVFGWIKGRLTSVRPARSALQTMLIGGLAAAGAFLFTRATAPLIERLIS
jgi:VIT1/CCC1 family predicted Fe2+/Mn2+ transporter